MSEYQTNLTEQQYRSNYGRLIAYTAQLRKDTLSGKISEEDGLRKFNEIGRNLGLTVASMDNREVTIHPDLMFDTIHPVNKRYLRDQYRVSKPVILPPKQFMTVGERSGPCNILNIPNVKNIMINGVDYSNRVRRELNYALCNTPNGIKAASPIFGIESRVGGRNVTTGKSTLSEDRCKKEFGEESLEIGNFHTHPGGHPYFSSEDLFSYAYHDDNPQYSNNSNCVVAKNNNKTQVRCARGVDVINFMSRLNINREELNKLPDDPKQNKFKNEFGFMISRNKELQNAFSCATEIAVFRRRSRKFKNMFW